MARNMPRYSPALIFHTAGIRPHDRLGSKNTSDFETAIVVDKHSLLFEDKGKAVRIYGLNFTYWH
jgi:hypothetical protein